MMSTAGIPAQTFSYFTTQVGVLEGMLQSKPPGISAEEASAQLHKTLHSLVTCDMQADEKIAATAAIMAGMNRVLGLKVDGKMVTVKSELLFALEDGVAKVRQEVTEARERGDAQIGELRGEVEHNMTIVQKQIGVIVKLLKMQRPVKENLGAASLLMRPMHLQELTDMCEKPFMKRGA